MTGSYIMFACMVDAVDKHKRLYQQYDFSYKYSILTHALRVLKELPECTQEMQHDIEKAFLYACIHMDCCTIPNKKCELHGAYEEDIYMTIKVCQKDGMKKSTTVLKKVESKLHELGVCPETDVSISRIQEQQTKLDILHKQVDQYTSSFLIKTLPHAMSKYYLGLDLEPLEQMLVEKDCPIMRHDLARKIVQYYTAAIKCIDQLHMCRECGKINRNKRKPFRQCKLCHRVAFCSTDCHKSSIKSCVHGHVVECGLLQQIKTK